MIWAKKTAGAVDDTDKMMSSSPKQNDMFVVFFAMISIQKSTDKVVYDNYPLHLFWTLYIHVVKGNSDKGVLCGLWEVS